MGDPALRLDLGPPDAAMAEADAVLVERLGNDHVLHAGGVEIPLLGEIGDTAVTARFLVRRRADLDGAGKSGQTARKASAAMTEAAMPPFMSQVPRP
jgi:hypothetical protein